MSSSKEKVVKPCAINDLADEHLANVFKQLPPYERLLVSEVSKRWYALSRIPWRDVSHLDISSIPSENIGGIVKKHCPNLQTVFAKGKDLSLNHPHLLSGDHLSSVKLYQCSAAVREQSNDENTPISVLSLLVSDNLPNAPLKELVLCDFDIPERDSLGRAYVGSLPASLERLQLNVAELSILHPNVFPDTPRYGYLFLDGLRQLNQLTCLCVHSSHNGSDWRFEWESDLREELRTLQNLRELSTGGDVLFGFDLPRLEVLFINNGFFDAYEAELENLATKHTALRILCITGSFDEECTIPERRLFPNGFGSAPVPPLKIFVGKQASEKIVFTKSPADALAIHPITEPLPEFLAKEEIAPLFMGVWLAAQIKEGAKHGSNWWKYDGDTATTFRSADVV